MTLPGVSAVHVLAAVIGVAAALKWVAITHGTVVQQSRQLEESPKPDAPRLEQLTSRAERSAFIARWEQSQVAAAHALWNILTTRALVVAAACGLLALWLPPPWDAVSLAAVALPAGWLWWANGQRQRVLAGLRSERARLLATGELPH
jgi:hypothetical protein